jgi:glycosyltransferase involved in cell wall biosynthesis
VVKRFVFAVPGDLATPTGGYAYDRRMIAELQKLGWQIDVVDLGAGFPWADDKTRATAQARLLMVPLGGIIVADGLALGVLPEAARRLRADHILVALVHHPLALESGLTAGQADILRASERAALAAAKHVIVTSPATARQLAEDYGLAPDKITVARPGNDAAPAAPGSTDGIVRLLSVGAIVPRKGFDVLIAALTTLAALPWRLTIAGDRTRDPQAAAQLDADIARHKLGARVTLLGAVSPERLSQLYGEADMFVLASRYEGYGMAYAEAIAHGLPVIGSKAGAIPDTVPAGAGLLVAPDDVGALAQALGRLIGDAEERKTMMAAAQAAARQLPSWRQSAEIFARALAALA